MSRVKLAMRVTPAGPLVMDEIEEILPFEITDEKKSSSSEIEKIRWKYPARIRHTTVRPESLSEDNLRNGLIKRQD